ncbi:hypothetical protein GAO09_00160 [Rhizobiales bacterium RZME27]|uniref:Uncharacterized protein n=1 Tax=Endobacterium cereale TaxID=2663029 RepID=A0A6A8A3Y6_9HYPH|nr:hypothetical protein [Endobacterium cereale]MEB2848551.1 hypothetical protein [Endobacterium cereale]MQY44487.1 hypothetical protein [Endobacterium cereale]
MQRDRSEIAVPHPDRIDAGRPQLVVNGACGVVTGLKDGGHHGLFVSFQYLGNMVCGMGRGLCIHLIFLLLFNAKAEALKDVHRVFF